MSGDVMEYPPSWEDFAEQYSITDSEEVYTNGSELISLFRVHQMVKHYFAEPLSRPSVVRCRDCRHAIDNGKEGSADYCGRPDGDGGYLLFGVEPDGFCAWGEKK